MLRPIATNEIAWLVRLLVAISRSINSTLGLTGVATPQGDEPPETVLQVSAVVCRWSLNDTPQMQLFARLSDMIKDALCMISLGPLRAALQVLL